MIGVPSEHAEQAALVRWAALQARTTPELALLLAIPNGGARNAITGARLKREGVRPGVPDLFLPVARGGRHGLFLELKRRRGGSVSADQRAWLRDLAGQGYHVAVCRGWDEAREAIAQYLAIGPETGLESTQADNGACEVAR